MAEPLEDYETLAAMGLEEEAAPQAGMSEEEFQGAVKAAI